MNIAVLEYTYLYVMSMSACSLTSNSADVLVQYGTEQKGTTNAIIPQGIISALTTLSSDHSSNKLHAALFDGTEKMYMTLYIL